MELSTILPDIITVVASMAGAAVSTAFLVGRRIGGMQEKEKHIERELETLKQGWRLELDTFKAEAEERINELVKRAEKNEDRHIHTAQEERDRWDNILRTLGQIEGMLKRVSFPPRR